MASVFLVSREPRTCDLVCGYLHDRDHSSTLATSYDAAMDMLRNNRFDAMIIDVQGLPRDESGSTFVQFNRWLGSEFEDESPICIYLLHKGARRPAFRVEGSVLKKPFAIEALGETLRLTLGSFERGASRPTLEFDARTNTLRSVAGEAHLTNIESALLSHLMSRKGEVLHPSHLLVDVWEYHDSAGANTLVRAHVSNLRRKLRQAAGTDELIQTVRGKGYRFIA